MKTAPLWRFVKRAGLTLTAATALLWLSSAFFHITYARAVAAPPGVNTGLGANTTDAEGFGFGHGMVGFFGQKFVLTGNPEGWSSGWTRFRLVSRLRASRFSDRTYEYSCSIAIVIPFFAGLAGLGYFMERRRVPVESPGACPECAYPRGDLAVGSPCPECGTTRPAQPAHTVRHGPHPRPGVERRRRRPAPHPARSCRRPPPA